MKQYIGTKIIHAEPQTKDGAEGYAVVYPDGYKSWSPKEAFEAAYRECDAMTFGLAVDALKLGHKVARKGWNGKGMWLGLVGGDQWRLAFTAPLACGDAAPLPWIGMKTADNKFVPWLASQTDVLAEDWEIIESK